MSGQGLGGMVRKVTNGQGTLVKIRVRKDRVVWHRESGLMGREEVTVSYRGPGLHHRTELPFHRLESAEGSHGRVVWCRRPHLTLLSTDGFVSSQFYQVTVAIPG